MAKIVIEDIFSSSGAHCSRGTSQWVVRAPYTLGTFAVRQSDALHQIEGILFVPFLQMGRFVISDVPSEQDIAITCFRCLESF